MLFPCYITDIFCVCWVTISTIHYNNIIVVLASIFTRIISYDRTHVIIFLEISIQRIEIQPNEWRIVSIQR